MCWCLKSTAFISTPTRKINYLYNAVGQKVEKTITKGSSARITSYQSGFHYESEVLKFFATAEGYVDIRARLSEILRVNYVYNYTDHLGNIRLSYTNNNASGITILEENHYYPFGLKHKKYGSVDKDLVCLDEDCYEVGIDVVPPQARKTHQYKVQNKEWQDDWGLMFMTSTQGFLTLQQEEQLLLTRKVKCSIQCRLIRS